MIDTPFGEWTVKAAAGPGKRGEARWVCECSCGSVATVYEANLRRGLSTKCRRHPRPHKMKYGRHCHDIPEYRVWTDMKTRCFNPNRDDFENYAGRGITVCERWLGPDGFTNFYADMGPRPTPQHTIERADNDGSYCPENCEWRTRLVQNNNKRSVPKVDYRGAEMTVAQAARLKRLPPNTVYRRIFKRGWSVEDALETPLREAKPKQADKIMLPVGGVTLSMREWAKRRGIRHEAIYARLRLGWTPEEAVMTPIQKAKGSRK